MQINKHQVEISRHRKARGLTLSKHKYRIFGGPSVSNKCLVVISGLAHSGKTLALLKLACDLPAISPRFGKNKALIIVNLGETCVELGWVILNALRKQTAISVPSDWEQDKREVVQAFAEKGFHIVLFRGAVPNMNFHNYELVHELIDDFRRTSFLTNGIQKYGLLIASVRLTDPIEYVSVLAVETHRSRLDGDVSHIYAEVYRNKLGPTGDVLRVCNIPQAKKSCYVP